MTRRLIGGHLVATMRGEGTTPIAAYNYLCDDGDGLVDAFGSYSRIQADRLMRDTVKRVPEWRCCLRAPGRPLHVSKGLKGSRCVYGKKYRKG